MNFALIRVALAKFTAPHILIKYVQRRQSFHGNTDVEERVRRSRGRYLHTSQTSCSRKQTEHLSGFDAAAQWTVVLRVRQLDVARFASVLQPSTGIQTRFSVAEAGQLSDRARMESHRVDDVRRRESSEPCIRAVSFLSIGKKAAWNWLRLRVLELWPTNENHCVASMDKIVSNYIRLHRKTISTQYCWVNRSFKWICLCVSSSGMKKKWRQLEQIHYVRFICLNVCIRIRRQLHGHTPSHCEYSWLNCVGTTIQEALRCCSSRW